MSPGGQTPSATMAKRSPLAQLLHALNQPLTGLQCSMEVALAAPRTAEEYVHGLREGLELTERMRTLVGAMREVAVEEDAPDGPDAPDEPEILDLKILLREVAEQLSPVADEYRVRIEFAFSSGESEVLPGNDFQAAALPVKGSRRGASALIFRMLESALSLAERESDLRIQAYREASEKPGQILLRCEWRTATAFQAFSKSELGLLVARAGWERMGAIWQRERAGDLETITLSLPGSPEKES